jgi:hypothetical protein
LFFHGVNNYTTASPNFFTKTDYIAEIGSGSRFPSHFPSQIRIVKAWTCKSTIFRRQTYKIIIILLRFYLTLPIFLLSLIITKENENMNKAELKKLVWKTKIETTYRYGVTTLGAPLNGPQLEKAKWETGVTVMTSEKHVVVGLDDRGCRKFASIKVIHCKTPFFQFVSEGKDWWEAVLNNRTLLNVILNMAKDKGLF